MIGIKIKKFIWSWCEDFHGHKCSCTDLKPVSSEISDLLLFVSYFAAQSEGISFDVYFIYVCCLN